MLAGTGVAAAGVAAYLVCGALGHVAPRSAREELAGALGPVRFAAGRVTGGFRYAPDRGRMERVVPSRRARSALVRMARQALGRERCGGSADAGIAMLIAGRARQAAVCLEGAAALGHPDGALLSDLSAAYLELGERRHDGHLLFKALTASDRALARPGAPPEAYFNRALALEGLFLSGEARRAWSDFLRVEPASAWSAEARRRVLALEHKLAVDRFPQRQAELRRAALAGDLEQVARLVGSFPQPAASYGEEQLLGEWAVKLATGGSAEAARLLAAARLVAGTVAARSGDRMLADAVAAIERCGESRPLRDAHRDLASGAALLRERRFGAARPLLASAAAGFARCSSGLGLWADLDLAICDFQGSDYRSASAGLDGLARHPLGTYPFLHARVEWLIGLIAGIEGRLGDALSALERALALYRQSGDADGLGALYALLAQNELLLGDERGAWDYRVQALGRLAGASDPVRAQGVLQELATAASNEGEPGTALSFENEAVAVARVARRADTLALALRRRVLILTDLGRLEEAGADLDEARTVLTEVSDAGLRESLQGEILAAAGANEMTRDPRRAVGSLTAAARTFAGTGYELALARVFVLRSRALAALGDGGAAEADLQRALAVLERQGRAVEDLGLRSQFLARAREVFDAAVGLVASRGRPSAALEIAERARAQVLLASYRQLRAGLRDRSAGRAGAATEALPPAAIQAALDGRTVVLEYAVLPEQLVAWSITRERVRMAVVHTPAGEVADLVDRLRTELREGSPGARSTAVSGRLFELLVRPFVDEIRTGGTVVVVPDRALFQVPFGALWDGRRDEPLVASTAVAVAPSATLFVELTRRADELRPGSSPAVLVLGSPLGARGSALPALPAAGEEAREIAALYPRAALLVGSAATRRAFLGELGGAEVVHVASHALARSDGASGAGIVFAGEDETASPLRPEELSCPRTALVFLAACGTALGSVSASEGPLSAARFFLGAGVPTVVASLWDVDDREAREVAVLFHRGLRAGLGSAEALRRVEVVLWKRGDSAAAWAAFEVVGAAAG